MTHKERCEVPVTWGAGDLVMVGNKQGVVRYVYTNGYTLVDFGETIKGGIFNNDSTFGNEEIKRHIKYARAENIKEAWNEANHIGAEFNNKWRNKCVVYGVKFVENLS